MKNRIKIIILIFIFVLRFVISFTLNNAMQFDSGFAKVIFSKDGKILSILTSSNGFFVFPQQKIPKLYERLLLEYEDKRFYFHPGIDFFSMFKATLENTLAKSVVSGASTITMQTVRLLKKRDRNLLEKGKEGLKALFLDFFLDKHKILRIYSQNAPFGFNVIGLKAAALLYFQRNEDTLSIAEYAFLAILPQSPNLILNSTGRIILKNKRDLLLRMAFKHGIIDKNQLAISLNEDIVSGINIPRQNAFHLLFKEEFAKDSLIFSTIDYELQLKSIELSSSYMQNLSKLGIFNLCLIVIDNYKGEIVSYIGNSAYYAEDARYKYIDMLMAKRSMGSALKPILYALSLDRNLMLPSALYPDVPGFIGDFAPKNFDGKFRGAVSIETALINSLNVPFVYLLKDYGVYAFKEDLKELGLSFDYERDFGLPLILGGLETRLYDLASLYYSMVKKLNENSNTQDFFVKPKISKNKYEDRKFINRISPEAIYLTLQSLTKLNREDAFWQSFEHSKTIAWKTGTSFANKDAVSIGVSPKYTVAVWVGNADGRGRPEIVGARVAGEFMFKIFDILKDEDKFKTPPELVQVQVCDYSGYLANSKCISHKNILAKNDFYKTPQSPYDFNISVSKDGKFRVNSSCYNVFELKEEPYMILPQDMAYYYKMYNPNYLAPPPFKEGCSNFKVDFSILNLKNGDRIRVSFDKNGNMNPIIVKAFAQDGEILYWHLGDEFLSKTSAIHEISIYPKIGENSLKVFNKNGDEILINFEVF